MGKETKVIFRLAKVSGKSIESHIDSVDKERITPGSLMVNFSLVTNISLEQSRIAVSVTLRYQFEGLMFYKSKISNTYEVPDLKSITRIDTGTQTITFKPNILPTLVEASFSMARGYLLAKAEGTFLENYPFPLIDTNVLMGANKIVLDSDPEQAENETVEI